MKINYNVALLCLSVVVLIVSRSYPAVILVALSVVNLIFYNRNQRRK